MQYKNLGHTTKRFVLESVKRILLKVAQQATDLKAVNIQKEITRLSDKSITVSYTENKTRKW